MSIPNSRVVRLAFDETVIGEDRDGEDREFDPMVDLLTAQSAKPNHLGEINLRTLTPFQRSLLVIDGTVTKFIEAYTMEPVEVVRLFQESLQLSADHPWLEAPKGTEVIARKVLLRGRYSLRLYAYAVSLIVPERLGEGGKQELSLDGEGLGRILLNSRLENRREVLWYGRERATRLPEAIHQLTGTEFISRVYRIIAGGLPIMLINENFPSGGDPLPAHH